MIESAAKGYAINHEYELNKSASFYEGYKSLKITVNDLVENGNLSPDKEDTVLNPKDNSSLNNLELILYLKNNQVYVAIDNNIC